MGLLQPDVGHGRRDGKTGLTGYGKAVTVISLAQAEAALAAAEALGVRVTLLSAPSAAASAGPGWFDAVVTLAAQKFPDAQCDAILDCGDAPGTALAALRHGVRHIRYSGIRPGAIGEIADQYGARIIEARPQSLDLQEIAEQGSTEACRAWLSG